MPYWRNFIFSDRPFEDKWPAIFKYQQARNPVYRRFCASLGFDSETPERKSAVPLLPIHAFKEASVTCEDTTDVDLKFQSSGTGGMQTSTHWIADKEIYRRSVLRGFQTFYDLNNAVILGYTPEYAENAHSSLIWMIRELISRDEIKKSRFLPLNRPLSQGEVNDIAASGRQLILFGAAFGLIDLVEQSSVQLPSNSIIIETGGMKTHQRAMSRRKMHQQLARGLGIDRSRIHSEYGMCELLSQSYAIGGNWFRPVPWMQVSIRDPKNPRLMLPPFQEGKIGIIDLANIHSCSFLLTGDRGLMREDGRFKVLGRWKKNDPRGCNFLIDRD